VSNLGPYQEITTLAKSLGGVDKMIKTIESDAAKKVLMKAGPVLLAVGALAGVGATKGIDAGKNAWAKYKEGEAAAAEAKEQLKAIVEESTNSDDPDEGPAGEPDDIGDEN
jgi:hypothetical protein